MPGYLERFRRNTLARCPSCGGVDLLTLGFIHHQPDCPRSPCQFCGHQVLPGHAREVYNGRPAHLDCRIDWTEHEEDRAEERRRG